MGIFAFFKKLFGTDDVKINSALVNQPVSLSNVFGKQKIGSYIVVPNGYVAVCVAKEKVMDILREGKHKLSAETLPILNSHIKMLKTNKKGKTKPYFYCDFYYVNLETFTDQYFQSFLGVTIKDKDFLPFNVKISGKFSYKVVNPDYLVAALLTRYGLISGDIARRQIGIWVGEYIDKKVQKNKPNAYEIYERDSKCFEGLVDYLNKSFSDVGIIFMQVDCSEVKLPPKIYQKVELTYNEYKLKKQQEILNQNSLDFTNVAPEINIFDFAQGNNSNFAGQNAMGLANNNNRLNGAGNSAGFELNTSINNGNNLLNGVNGNGLLNGGGNFGNPSNNLQSEALKRMALRSESINSAKLEKYEPMMFLSDERNIAKIEYENKSNNFNKDDVQPERENTIDMSAEQNNNYGNNCNVDSKIINVSNNIESKNLNNPSYDGKYNQGQELNNANQQNNIYNSKNNVNYEPGRQDYNIKDVKQNNNYENNCNVDSKIINVSNNTEIKNLFVDSETINNKHINQPENKDLVSGIENFGGGNEGLVAGIKNIGGGNESFDRKGCGSSEKQFEVTDLNKNENGKTHSEKSNYASDIEKDYDDFVSGEREQDEEVKYKGVNYKKCERCSKANPIGAKNCFNCGAEFTKKCPSCGNDVRESDFVCPHCKAVLL